MSRVHARGTGAGIPIAVASAFAFAASGPFAKLLIEAGWSPGAIACMRVGIAAMLLLPLTIRSLRRTPGMLGRHWKWIVAYGLVAVAAVQLFYYLAVERLPVGIALLIEYLAPVLLLFGVWARTRVRPAWLALVGAALALIGLVFVLSPTSTDSLDPLGVVFGLVAALSLMTYFLLGAHAPADLPPLALIGGGLLIASFALGALGATGVLAMEFVFSDAVPFFGTTVAWWVPLGMVVLFGTVIAYLLGLLAAIRLGSRLASFLGMIEVVAVVLIAALLLGEVPTVVQLCGSAVLIAGVVAVRLAPDRSHVGAADPLEVGPVTAPIAVIPPPIEHETSDAHEAPDAHEATVEHDAIGEPDATNERTQPPHGL